MKMLITFSLLMSYFMTLSGHPMILISIISAQTLTICLIIMLISPTSWFSFILFLVFMGGLMVLFIYISSLASNEKFNLNLRNNIPSILFMMLAGAMLAWIVNSQCIKALMNSSQNFVFQVYSTSVTPIISLTMIYLLLALIIIVNITSLREGALRQIK